MLSNIWNLEYSTWLVSRATHCSFKKQLKSSKGCMDLYPHVDSSLNRALSHLLIWMGMYMEV